MKRFAYAAVMLIVLGVVLTGCRGERLSLDELLPAAEAYGEHHISIYGLLTGMIVMAVSLILLA